MRSGATAGMPTSVRRGLKKLGSDINIARRKRSMSTARVAEAAGISLGTLRRLERGDASVSLGVLAMVLLALGEDRRLATLIDMSADAMGLMLDLDSLPKRITSVASGPVKL